MKNKRTNQPPQPSIDTWAGAHVAGDVHAGGDFIGRDKYEIHQHFASPGGRGRDREDLLDELWRASIGRCTESWKALRVPEDQATRWASDASVGQPAIELHPSHTRPVVLLLGDVGGGKSLTAERLLQATITRAREDHGSPVPLYLNARQAKTATEEGLQEAVLRASAGLGDPRTLGAAVVIDCGENLGLGAVRQLLANAGVLVRQWPGTAVVLTARPMGDLVQRDEASRVPELPPKAAHQLVSQVAGWELSPMVTYKWPIPLQDAIRRPLFAILLGTFYRDHGDRLPQSTGELFCSLVERALPVDASDEFHKLLQRLAELSLKRDGGPVAAAEIGNLQQVNRLLDSGLLVQDPGGLIFPLPVLLHWFGGERLRSEPGIIKGLLTDQEQLEIWRFAFIVATGTFSYEDASAVLEPLAQTCPAFAAGIIQQGLGNRQLHNQMMPPPAVECGNQLVRAVSAWVEGVGDSLARLIAPLRPDGILRPLGISRHGAWISTSWYQGDEEQSTVVQLSPNRNVKDWPGHCVGLVHPQPAWPWEWALEDLRSRLSAILRRRALPTEGGIIWHEATWLGACRLLGRSHQRPQPILLDELEALFDLLPPWVADLGYGMGPMGGRTAIIGSALGASTSPKELGTLVGSLPSGGAIPIGDGRAQQVAPIREAVQKIRAAGESQLEPPWPSSDVPYDGTRTWESYSPEQVLARARVIYSGAAQAYETIVQRWFHTFRNRLELAVILPARLDGVLYRLEFEGSHEWHLYWHWEPRAEGETTTVNIRLGDEPREPPDFWAVEALYARLVTRRPQAAAWIAARTHSDRIDLYEATPGTELAYKWLWHDLAQIGWVTGHPGPG
jgi:hypothetical protein